MAATILLVSTSGPATCSRTARPAGGSAPTATIQFRYQVAGIVMGAVMAVVLAKLFMSAYPVLRPRPDDDARRPAAGAMGVGDDLQVRRRAAQPHRRQALPAHGDLDRHRASASRPSSCASSSSRAPRYQAFVAVRPRRLQHRLRARRRRASVALRVVVRRVPQPADLARGSPRGGVLASFVNSLPKRKGNARRRCPRT